MDCITSCSSKSWLPQPLPAGRSSPTCSRVMDCDNTINISLLVHPTARALTALCWDRNESVFNTASSNTITGKTNPPGDNMCIHCVCWECKERVASVERTLVMGKAYLDHGLSTDNMCCECRELFKSLDTDASNTIEAKELADGLKAQGYNISQQELAQLMGRVDFDRNGTLDLEEFISGLIDWTEVSLTAFGSLPECVNQKWQLAVSKAMRHFVLAVVYTGVCSRNQISPRRLQKMVPVRKYK